MTSYQKFLLSVFIPVTPLIIALDYVFPSQFFVDIIKFSTIAVLFLFSLYIRKRYNEQLLLLLALFFAVSGDFFFVLLDRFLSISWPIGIVSFSISYFLLTVVFSKANSLVRIQLILTAVPVLSLVLPVIYLSYHEVSAHILPVGIIFITVLSLMTWSAIKTLFGSYYSTQSAKLMAASGFLILICDSSVILSQFGPACPHFITLLLKSITWAAWIPAWTIIAVLIGEDKLLNER